MPTSYDELKHYVFCNNNYKMKHMNMRELLQVKDKRREIIYLSLVLILTFGSLIHALNNDWRVFFLAITGLVVFVSITFFTVSLGIFFGSYPKVEGTNPEHTIIGLILVLVLWVSIPLIFKFICNIPMWRRIPYSYLCIMMCGYFLYSIFVWIAN